MAKNDIDELSEAKINEAYARAAERTTGIKPMSEKQKVERATKESGREGK